MVGELRASHVIHLHRLMAAVHAEFRNHGMDEERVGEYGDHDVAPADFKATKSEHERALMALSTALSEWAAEQMDHEREASAPAPEGDHEPEPRREAGATR